MLENQHQVWRRVRLLLAEGTFDKMVRGNDTMAGRAVQRLSSLQKRILAMAQTNHIQEHRTVQQTKGADLYYSEIMAVIYGFPSNKLWETEWGSGKLTGERNHSGQKFNRQAIGLARYNAAQAAISRALHRLEARGLVVCVRGAYNTWHGCSLTSTGLAFKGNG
jgi:hypothetical protein